MLEHPSATFEDGKVMSEIQLYLITLKLQGSNPRMRLADVEYEEIERWKMEWAHLFSKFFHPYSFKNSIANHQQPAKRIQHST